MCLSGRQALLPEDSLAGEPPTPEGAQHQGGLWAIRVTAILQKLIDLAAGGAARCDRCISSEYRT